MNLRDEIQNHIGEFASAVVEDRSVAVSREIHESLTDAILAKVREALLSDEALDAAMTYVFSGEAHTLRPDVRKDWEKELYGAIADAFDAITGGDK